MKNDAGVYVSLDELIALRPAARGFSFLPRQPIHSVLAGRHASRFRGRGLDFEELRRYQPGDDVRQIDWKATVRTRKTQLRVFTEERERTVLLLVDQRLGMFFGSRRQMKSVTATEVAALAAWRVLQQKDRIGALIFNDSEIQAIPPHRSQGTVMRILQTLVVFNKKLSLGKGLEGNPGMLNRCLGQAARLASHDALICLLTDGSGHDEETRRHLTSIAAHNDVIVGLVSDPMEEQLPSAGNLVVSDGQLQLRIDTGNARLRAEFDNRRSSNLADARKFLLQRETPILQISTAEPAVEQLRNQLGGGRR